MGTGLALSLCRQTNQIPWKPKSHKDQRAQDLEDPVAQHLGKGQRDQGLGQSHKQVVTMLGLEPESPGAQLDSGAG